MLCSGWEEGEFVTASYIIRLGRMDNHIDKRLVHGEDKWKWGVGPHDLLTVEGPPNSCYGPLLHNRKMPELSPEEATARVKGFARNIGADLVGIAKIDAHWIYSHRGEIHMGNWEDWGKEIHADHPYAIVLAEEMGFDMVGPAPHTPSVMESMKNYAKGAYITTQLAAYIANMSYEATTNHLRHYTAILPPLAA